MGLYNRVTGSTSNQTQQSAGPASGEPKPFEPIELEQAFGGSYRSYRVNEDQRWMLICSLIE